MFLKRTLFGLRFRNVVTAASTKQNQLNPKVQLVTSEEGFQVVNLPEVLPWNGLSNIAIAFKAGSRYESFKNAGITHLIRRSFGLSTSDFTSVNLVRHFQQMGASVKCWTTREHIVYMVSVAPNLAMRAGFLMANMASDVLYYHWELKETAYKLMKKDIDILNRRNLSGLGMELLHEAAFGSSFTGCGLGRSLFASTDRVDSYSIDQIQDYHNQFYTPSQCTLCLTGANTNSDAMDVLKHVKSGLIVHPPKSIPTSGQYGFIGGEIRRDLYAAPCVYAYMAWPTHLTGLDSAIFDLAVSYFNGSTNRISYGGITSKSPLMSTALSTEHTEAVSFHKPYADHGLFGFAIVGASAEAVGKRIKNIINMLTVVNVGTGDLQQAKKICKADILIRYEDPIELTMDLVTGVSQYGNNYQLPIDRQLVVDKITSEKLNTALKKTFSTKIPALSLVGPNLGAIDPLVCILKV